VEVKSVFYVVSEGKNHYDNRLIKGKTIHAEYDAIKKLKQRDSNSIKKINMLVIKTSITGKLGNSKPCLNCILDIINLTPKKGYRVDKLYYSDENGSIQKVKLNKLIKLGHFHVSSFYKNHGFKHPWIT